MKKLLRITIILLITTICFSCSIIRKIRTVETKETLKEAVDSVVKKTVTTKTNFVKTDSSTIETTEHIVSEYLPVIDTCEKDSAKIGKVFSILKSQTIDRKIVEHKAVKTNKNTVTSKIDSTSVNKKINDKKAVTTKNKDVKRTMAWPPWLIWLVLVAIAAGYVIWKNKYKIFKKVVL